MVGRRNPHFAREDRKEAAKRKAFTKNIPAARSRRQRPSDRLGKKGEARREGPAGARGKARDSVASEFNLEGDPGKLTKKALRRAAF